MRESKRERRGAIPGSQGASKHRTVQHPEVSEGGPTWLLGDLDTDMFYTRKISYADAMTKARPQKQPI